MFVLSQEVGSRKFDKSRLLRRPPVLERRRRREGQQRRRRRRRLKMMTKKVLKKKVWSFLTPYFQHLLLLPQTLPVSSRCLFTGRKMAPERQLGQRPPLQLPPHHHRLLQLPVERQLSQSSMNARGGKPLSQCSHHCLHCLGCRRCPKPRHRPCALHCRSPTAGRRKRRGGARSARRRHW